MAEPFHDAEGNVDVPGIVKFSGTLLGSLVSLFNPAAGGAITVGVNTGVDAFAGKKTPAAQNIVPKLPTAEESRKARSYYGLPDKGDESKGDESDDKPKAYPITIPKGGAGEGKPVSEDDEGFQATPTAPPEAIDGAPSVIVHPSAIPSPEAPAETPAPQDTDSERIEVEPDTLTGPARLRQEDVDTMNNIPDAGTGSDEGDKVSWLAGFGRRRYS